MNSTTEIFTCPIDLNIYDTNTRKPISIVPCGHSICYHCYDVIKKSNNQCPICRMKMTGFVNIFLALNYLDQASSSKNNNAPVAFSAVIIKFYLFFYKF